MTIATQLPFHSGPVRLRQRVAALGLLALSVLPLSSQAITPETLQRSWQPSVELAGAGDPTVAIARLREMTELQRVMMHNTHYHPETQSFVDGMWASLERFDLQRFYKLLPDEDGEWRQLQWQGGRQGDAYHVGPATATPAADAAPPLSQLGDVAALIRAREIELEDATHYLLDSELQLGLGVLSWPSVMAASQQTFRIIVEGDPAFQARAKSEEAFRFRSRVHAMNPALSAADVDIIAPLWASFPEMWELLAKLGKVEDVVLESTAGKPYKELEAAFVIDPDMMKRLYPDLARHLSRMSNLLQVQLDLHDERGSVLQLEVDSETLRGRLATVVMDGELVPMKAGKAVLDAPAPAVGETRRFVAKMQTRMSILGIVTHMNNMKTHIDYRRTDQGAEIVSRIVDVPEVRVEGRALGLMPAGLINAFLPKSIDDLMIEFLSVACKGNGGRGIEARMEFVQPEPDQPAFVKLHTAFEGLDNFMVRIGMGIVSDRVIPSTGVSEDIQRLVFDTQEAFAKDLDNFAQVAVASAQ